MPSIPRKKGAVLRYSRRLHDSRVYGLYIYRPHFMDIIAQRCTNDIQEARKRVIITNSGRYIYHPSQAYVNAYKNYINKSKSTNYVGKTKDKYNQGYTGKI